MITVTPASEMRIVTHHGGEPINFTAVHAVTPSMVRWCQYLARGGRLTRSGMYHCVAANAGQITYTMLNALEATGLITLEPTASDTPQLRHMRAQLTAEGHKVAALPGLEGV